MCNPASRKLNRDAQTRKFHGVSETCTPDMSTLIDAREMVQRIAGSVDKGVATEEF